MQETSGFTVGRQEERHSRSWKGGHGDIQLSPEAGEGIRHDRGTPLPGRQQGLRDAGFLGCHLAGVREERKGLGRQPEQSLGTWIKYFTQKQRLSPHFTLATELHVVLRGKSPTKHAFIFC